VHQRADAGLLKERNLAYEGLLQSQERVPPMFSCQEVIVMAVEDAGEVHPKVTRLNFSCLSSTGRFVLHVGCGRGDENEKAREF
jgi:hypothetical protein